MRVTRELEITAEEFFDALLQGVVDDIAKSSKKDVSKDKIKKGFKFTHTGQDAYSRVTLEVLDYQENTYYKAKRTSFGSVVTAEYSVVPTEKGISVTLDQIVLENGKERKYKFFNSFFEIMSLGRLTDHLYGIQKQVMNKKEGFVDKSVPAPFSPKYSKKK